MLIGAIIIFVLAAVFGLILITKVFKNLPRPMGIILVHGLLAATGLVLVLSYVVMNKEKAPMASLILFVVAAIGGFTMLAMDMTKKMVPKGLAIVHALTAAAGLILLILFIV